MLFRYHIEKKNKGITNCKENNPIMEDWNCRVFYELCVSWNILYMNTLPGFFKYLKITEVNERNDANVQGCYISKWDKWSSLLYNTLVYPGDLPKGDATEVLKTCSNNQFIFLCQINMLFNVKLMEVPMYIIYCHNLQEKKSTQNIVMVLLITI